jgi:hypothetical protein
MGKFLSFKAQDGRFVSGKKSMDHCGSRYCTYRTVSIIENVGSEGKEHNLVVSLRFNVTECVRGSYSQRIMGLVGDFVSV